MKKKIVPKDLSAGQVNIIAEPGEKFQITIMPKALGVVVSPPMRRGRPPITLDMTVHQRRKPLLSPDEIKVKKTGRAAKKK